MEAGYSGTETSDTQVIRGPCAVVVVGAKTGLVLGTAEGYDKDRSRDRG